MPSTQDYLTSLVSDTRAAGKPFLDKLPTTVLLELFNNVTGKTTKKFASRDKAIEQTLKAIRELPEGRIMTTAAHLALIDEGDSGLDIKTTPDDTGVAPATRPEKGFRIKLPYSGKVRPPKEKTKRAALLEKMLDKGISLEEVMSQFGWAKKDAYEGIRHIHISLGYGIDQYADGRFYAHTELPGHHTTKEKPE